jgi:predicted RNA-binding protein YlqC (UPF0109 family)
MIRNFVKEYIQLIVKYPDNISVDIELESNSISNVIITSHKDDIAKIIGKKGNMVKALKTIINSCTPEDNIYYKIIAQIEN